MVFKETKLSGAFVIEPERHDDERGFFACTWRLSEFEERGFETSLAQCAVSYNKKTGTLRGMHYQTEPYGGTKLVRCTRGAVYDVIIDLRSGSPTFAQWVAEELSEANYRMLYIPRGFAHGFQTLADNTELTYQMTEFYHPEAAAGVRWDDPAFGIKWPLKVTTIVARDRDYPNFRLPQPCSKESRS